jgi:hypothetical protein
MVAELGVFSCDRKSSCGVNGCLGVGGIDQKDDPTPKSNFLEARGRAAEAGTRPDPNGLDLPQVFLLQ